MIAFLRRESGSEAVAAALLSPDTRVTAHAINVCEVYYDFFRTGGRIDAMRIVADLERLGVRLNAEVSRSLWQDAGAIKAIQRRVSLADCFAIAYARSSNATVLTSDRHEFDAIVESGLCRVEFFR